MLISLLLYLRFAQRLKIDWNMMKGWMLNFETIYLECSDDKKIVRYQLYYDSNLLVND